MASNYTENLGLCQWEATDHVLRTDFNADNIKIDAVLQEHSSNIKTLTEQMTATGNCQIYRRTYIGDGDYKNVIRVYMDFPAPPLVVLISNSNTGETLTAVSPCQYGYVQASTLTAVPLAWSGSSLTWTIGPSSLRMNENNVTYMVIALFQK